MGVENVNLEGSDMVIRKEGYQFALTQILSADEGRKPADPGTGPSGHGTGPADVPGAGVACTPCNDPGTYGGAP